MADFVLGSGSALTVVDRVDGDGEIRIEIADGGSTTWLSLKDAKALRRHLKQLSWEAKNG